MTLGLTLTLIAIIALIFLSAFFSGSETALTAVSRARMHALAKEGNSHAKLVNALIAMRERLIGALLLGNNLVNILASVLATSLFLQVFGQAGIAYATLAMTILVVIFAEVLPKTYALGRPEGIALTLAPVLRVVVLIFSPFARAIEIIVATILRWTGGARGAAIEGLTAHKELRGAIELHLRAGGVVKAERDMLGGVLDLPKLDIDQLMVHRVDMQAINADDDPKEIVQQVLDSPYSRLPVWKDKSENIIGVLHAKELLRAVQKAGGDMSQVKVEAIAAEPWFVPETTSVHQQLNAFLQKKQHFALVVDEYGEVQGLVTLEDILEEIVGQIADEFDITTSGIRMQPDGSLIVDGSVPIRDLNRLYEWELPEEEATTIAGLVIHEAQTIPETGRHFVFYGFHFEILERKRNKITKLKIIPPHPRKSPVVRPQAVKSPRGS